MARILNRTVLTLSWVLRVFIIMLFINTVLGLFEWTREWAQLMAGLARKAIGGVWSGFVGYLPDLNTAVVIIFRSQLSLHQCKVVFQGVERRRINLPGFYPEWS